MSRRLTWSECDTTNATNARPELYIPSPPLENGDQQLHRE